MLNFFRIFSLLLFFFTGSCCLSVATESFFIYFDKATSTYSYTLYMYHISSIRHRLLAHACMFAVQSSLSRCVYMKYKTWEWKHSIELMHSLHVNLCIQRNMKERQREKKHSLWIIHESLTNKNFSDTFHRIVYFIVLMHLAGCYELHTRLHVFVFASVLSLFFYFGVTSVLLFSYRMINAETVFAAEI